MVALLAVVGSVYALVRHYAARAPEPAAAPAASPVFELPAPELLPVTK